MKRPLGTLVVLATPLVVAGFVLGAARQDAPTPTDDSRAPVSAPIDPLPRLRTIARMMVNIEGRHRTQAWELEQIARTCEKNRIFEPLRLVIRTAHTEVDDYSARMQDFERELGSDLFGRMRAAMDAGPGTAPRERALIPDPPPPPPPSPDEIEAQQAEKRDKAAAQKEEEGEDG